MSEQKYIIWVKERKMFVDGNGFLTPHRNLAAEVTHSVAKMLVASPEVEGGEVYPANVDPRWCDKCDGPGGVKTFANQCSMPINGRVQCIDHCIAQIVAALNAGGIETVASCCGHGTQDGNIKLRDGRRLRIEGSRHDYTGKEMSNE